MPNWNQNQVKRELTLDNIGEIGSKIREKLIPNTIAIVSGPMGVGKTTLIKKILYDYEVNSPSFLHVIEYGDTFAHIDAYTIKSDEAMVGLDLPKMLMDRCVIVEWGELFAELLQQMEARIVKLTLEYDLASDRRFIFATDGDIFI